MALTRIKSFNELSVIILRLHHPANFPLNDVQNVRSKFPPARPGGFHVSGVRRYPDAPKIPLPVNVSEIFGNETGRFTPERSRDIATPVLVAGSEHLASPGPKECWNTKASNESWGSTGSSDQHVDSYDCFGAVNLHSSMQSTVPKPFSSAGKSTHLNMPGGQWSEGGKYLAEFMQKSHYAILKHRKNRGRMQYSTHAGANDPDAKPVEKLTNIQKLKQTFKDYGSTVVVFHVGISLISLGVCYAVVSSGLDISAFIKKIPNSSERLEVIMTNSSTFVVAYAVHKIFAPLRAATTVAAAPFIVRYLRRIGILKMPKT